jgi:hypothetical protein
MRIDELVLKVEDVPRGYLRGIGPQNRSAGCFDQLGVHAEFLAIGQDGAGENRIN